MALDPYVDEQGRLKTLLTGKTTFHIAAKEANLTAFAARNLQKDPIKGNFDFDHLKETHRRIFEDVFSWAGKPRTVEMGKGSSIFCRVDYVESQANRILSHLGRDIEKWRGASTREKKEIPEKLAGHLNEINALHPFREGNGRTQKAFIGQVANEFGLEIRWDKMKREDFIAASVEGFRTGKPDAFVKLLKRYTQAIDKENER
ncbi:Fic family protein [Microcoleus sp. herbarium8]|uniref:Fic/DOC family protein n=1 Tax=Microcoleus sp. herbarium8 TaxID=3055436 RepID=UPI002FD53B06